MKKTKFNTTFSNGHLGIELELDLFSFQENDIQFLYSPALDLTGYGKSQEEANKSFQITLQEFIDFTTKKSTLFKELKRLGWKTDPKSNKTLHAPHISELLSTNNEFYLLMNSSKDYYKTRISVPI